MLDTEIQALVEAEKQSILQEEQQAEEETIDDLEMDNDIPSVGDNKYRRFTEILSTGINYVLYFFYALTIGLVLNLFTFIAKGVVDMISKVADKIYEENDKYVKGEQEFNYKKFMGIAFAIILFVVVVIVVAIYLFCRL